MERRLNYSSSSDSIPEESDWYQTLADLHKGNI